MIIYFLPLSIIIFDQLVKFILISINFKIIKNYGFAFNLLADYPINYLIIINLILIGIFFIVFKKADKKNNMIGLSLILAGGISNLIDRLKYGYVIDYFNFAFLFSFNISDLALTIGIITLIYDFITTNNISG